MLRNRIYLLIIVFILAGNVPAQKASGQTAQKDVNNKIMQSEARITAELLATFLITGRNILAEAQTKYRINDYRLGNKGFTPTVFESLINEDFKRQTGVDILKGNGAGERDLNYLKILINASEKICAEYQLIINTKGIGFKRFIPAIYGREISDIFYVKTGIQLKQTSIKFRNTYNTPDDTEARILAEMAKPDYPKDKTWFSDDGDSFRLMKPLYIKKSCLICHGAPKGALDIAGRKKEGYQLGELRGAITVLIKKQGEL